jgi:aminoglycoside N3'-acetyltransferase
VTAIDLDAALAAVGVAAGAVVVVHPCAAALPGGAPDAASLLYEALCRRLGDDGTIVVEADFHEYGRSGTPFVYEESYTELDPFNTLVRGLPGAVRSLHPIFSVVAAGPRAREVAEVGTADAYGYGSPWDRLLDVDATLLFAGRTIREGMPFTHYLEQRHGVPHCYVKLFDAPVLRGGRRIDRPFTACLRYLDFGVAYDLTAWERLLRDRGVLREAPVGSATVQAVGAAAALRCAMEALDRDVYFFLKSPPAFRPGEAPLTGPARRSAP